MNESEVTGVWSRLDMNQLNEVSTELNEVLHPVLADAGIGAWRYFPDRHCFYFDELLRSLYGMPEYGALPYELVENSVHEEDRQQLCDSLTQVVAGTQLRCRHRIVLRDGSYRWFYWYGRKAEEGSEGDVIFGICVDVTKEIQTRYELSAREKHFHSLATGVPGMFSYVDTNHRMQFISNEFCKEHDVKYADVVGCHMLDLVGPEDYERRIELINRGLSGEVVSYEEQRVNKQGNTRLETVTYQPDFDESGQVRGIFTLRVDITNRRELEQDLRAATEELKRSNADLEQFAYVASHDLKAPLRAMQVLLDWLTEDLKDYDEGEVQQNLALLGTRTTRLSGLLDDLLNYSRVGRNEEPPENVELAELVEEIGDLLDPGESMSISTAGEPVTLTADRAALHQVLRNLIGNAVKHHPGPQGAVVVSAEDCGDFHTISVADDGAGISPEYHEKVFQMFQTLKPRDEVEGSGMGLAIVERVIRKQGGRIWIEQPETGSGTVFKFNWKKQTDKQEGTST